MQILTGFLSAIGRLWARGCLGKGVVIVGALFVLGLCGSLFGRGRTPVAIAPAPTVAAAVLMATSAPTPTAAVLPTATAVLATIPTDAPTAVVHVPIAVAPEPTIAPTDAPAIVSSPVPTAEPTAEPAPAAPPQPLPASFNNCQEDPNFAQAPNYPVQIVTVNKSSEVVTLKNVSPDPVNLDGWRMCSIKGNQRHPIGGALAPGEQRDFPGPDAPIWSNSDPDPGALYDTQGRLVSYW